MLGTSKKAQALHGGGFLRCLHCQQASSIPLKEGSCSVVLGPQETWVVLMKDLNLPWSAQAEAPFREDSGSEGVEGSCRLSGI